MLKYFIDIEFKDFKKGVDFISDNEFVFDLMDSPFDYDVLVPVNKKGIYIFRCWVNSPEDLKHFIINK